VGEELAGRYRLEEVIGVGGMGAVFRATHLQLQRELAVKIIHQQLETNETSMERFFREARAVTRIPSRGMVDVDDLDVDAKHGPFIAMELLRGQSLSERLRKGAMPLVEAQSLVAELLDVLDVVHARKVVHRDLKPPNVYLHLDEEGERVVKVLDFGVARVTGTTLEMRLTRTGQLLGTPRYMAPEQARGERADHQADLFAAGLILYCCITGRPPYDGYRTGEVLERLQHGPTPLRISSPGLPTALYTWMDQALAADPEERFQDAGSMADKLRAIPLEGVQWDPSRWVPPEARTPATVPIRGARTAPEGRVAQEVDPAARTVESLPPVEVRESLASNEPHERPARSPLLGEEAPEVPERSLAPVAIGFVGILLLVAVGAALYAAFE